MKLEVSSKLNYFFPERTRVIVAVEASLSHDQDVLSEELWLPAGVVPVRDTDPASGERRFRAEFSGHTEISYRAVVDNGQRETIPLTAAQQSWPQLPREVLPYLLPSRFCPSDEFQRFARREFGGIAAGGARVAALLDWLSANLDYVSGISHASTTAHDTFVDRAGVCRDFTHLGVTLTRALDIPARAVSAYALDLNPPDFHAVFEVFLDGRWWLADATRLAPVAGLVRIASGRDAADIAFLSSDRPCQCLRQSVGVRAMPDGDLQAA